MHEAWDENYECGYEWWMMTEAKKVFHLFHTLFIRISHYCHHFWPAPLRVCSATRSQQPP